MKNIYNFTHEQLAEEMIARGQKKFRATQLYTWLYQKNVHSFEEMSDVATKFREELKENYTMNLPTIFTKQESIDGTIKLLLVMEDGAKVECVLMRYEYGNSICISSQVGCNMGCSFCASGLLKKQRDLTCGEMVAQILVMNSCLQEQERISHVVVMGTGEPFDNYDQVMSFIRIINHPHALAIGARHISVSTCGIPQRIMDYANEGLQTNLAISLHAPTNELRNQLMPINKAYNLEDLLSAVKYYEVKTNRRVTFEYILIKDFNDSSQCARELSRLVKGTHSYINLIPINEVASIPFQRPSRDSVRAFCDLLKNLGTNVTIRKEFGHDIDAACGQLRAKKEGAL